MGFEDFIPDADKAILGGEWLAVSAFERPAVILASDVHMRPEGFDLRFG